MLLLTMHHIISDGWSSEIISRELGVLYQAFSQGQASPLPALPIQYADYAVWQRGWLQGAVLERQIHYWREQLAGVVPLELPTDHPRPPVQTHRGALFSAVLPSALSQQLRALSRREDVTLFMLLLAAFQVLLARYSGQRDIAVGTAIVNRIRKEVEGLIGFFVNTLVLRTQVQERQSFLQFLEQVRKVALGAYAHQDVPFEHLVEVLRPEREASRSPLFQVAFGVQLEGPGNESGSEQQVQPLEVEYPTAKFDLTWNVTDRQTGLVSSIAYNIDLFEVTTIQQMVRHWQRLLEGIVAAPTVPLAHLSLLGEEERQALLRLGSPSQAEPGLGEWNVLQLVGRQAALQPDSLAVGSEETQLSYGLLEQRSNRAGASVDTEVWSWMRRAGEH